MLITMFVTVCWSNIVFGGDYVVVNKTESKERFTVVNKTRHTEKTRTVETMKTVGCVCSKGYNCSAGFCKANGGSGCPNTCPINGVKEVVVNQSSVGASGVVFPQQTYGMYSNCPNGNCASPSFQRNDGWYPGKRLGR